MKYSELSKAQKRCIDAFVRIRPDLATAESITRPEVVMLFDTLYDARADGGEKIGFPMWLIKGPKVSRGVYVFPAPGATQEVKAKDAEHIAPVTAAKIEEEDKEFFTDLQEYGIMETTE